MDQVERKVCMHITVQRATNSASILFSTCTLIGDMPQTHEHKVAVQISERLLICLCTLTSAVIIAHSDQPPAEL